MFCRLFSTKEHFSLEQLGQWGVVSTAGSVNGSVGTCREYGLKPSFTGYDINHTVKIPLLNISCSLVPLLQCTAGRTPFLLKFLS